MKNTASCKGKGEEEDPKIFKIEAKRNAWIHPENQEGYIPGNASHE